jgi:hypothetical protein
MVKLLATLAGATGTATSCTNSAALAGTAGFPIAPAGMAAWGTTLHANLNTANGGPFATTETRFTPATLSTGTGGELASLTNRCTNIIGNMSGFGICASCQAGALGAAKK